MESQSARFYAILSIELPYSTLPLISVLISDALKSVVHLIAAIVAWNPLFYSPPLEQIEWGLGLTTT